MPKLEDMKGNERKDVRENQTNTQEDREKDNQHKNLGLRESQIKHRQVAIRPVYDRLRH